MYNGLMVGFYGQEGSVMRELDGWILTGIVLLIVLSGCNDKLTKDDKPISEVSAAIDAEALFIKKCKKCHGKDGREHALGTSNIIAGESRSELIEKIEGYKNGTYGGSLKGVMTPQALALTSNEIEALAEYISKL